MSALILGSHAMHDAFAVIRWNNADFSSTVISLLWSEAVIAEVLVFFVLGPSLLNRVGARGTVLFAAIAGAARWLVMSQTTNLFVLAIVQPLHGVTLHSCTSHACA